MFILQLEAANDMGREGAQRAVDQAAAELDNVFEELDEVLESRRVEICPHTQVSDIACATKCLHHGHRCC